MANEIKNGPQFSWLVSFLAVTKARSYTRAEELTKIRQPTLSKRVSKLEKWIGHKLLTETNPIKLTPKGEKLFHKIEKVTIEIYNLRFEGENLLPYFMIPENSDRAILRELFSEILGTGMSSWPKGVVPPPRAVES